jgi:hypothetical protein
MLSASPVRHVIRKADATMKLKIAALATAVLTTLGSVALTTGSMAVDAGKSDKGTNGGWCC